MLTDTSLMALLYPLADDRSSLRSGEAMVFLFWIVFDTAMAVRMAFVSPEHGIPIWECLLWGGVGLAIGLWAFLSLHFERRRHDAQAAELREQL